MGYLTGIRNLVEAGWGLELKKVIAWQESEVEVLVSFGSGAQAEGLLAQFVSDLRTLSGGDVVSDVALDRGSGPVLLRITIPNRGAEPTVAVR